MTEFGRPTWWVSVALQGKNGRPVMLDRLEPEAVNWFLKVARLVLSGVGTPELEKLFAGHGCMHLQRPATDKELARADLSRMCGEVTR